MEIPPKLKIELPYDSVVLFLGMYLKKHYRDTCISMFIAALFTIAKLWNLPRCPYWMNVQRKCFIYTQWSLIQP
jgi:hypothetical protein